MRAKHCFIISIIILCSCKMDKSNSANRTEIKLSTTHSGEPNLSKAIDGKIYLSWVEYENDSLDILRFAKLEGNGWSDSREISRGNNWFVNWADFPSLINSTDNNLTAHWLQKSADGTYDYDVHISQSNDGGESWSSSIIPHNDGVNAEHGFVSMTPTPDGKTFAVWLDGRNTKNEENNAMTIRSAEIDHFGNISEEIELDNRVCDCCQTGSTWTDQGPIVVYRDRSIDEIRDIGIVRKINGNWTQPKTLYNDSWKIAGCPVNGPAIDSEGKNVIVAWYTMKDENPVVLAALSHDYGANFDDPITIDKHSPLGRVDAIIHKGKYYVSWMSSQMEMATIFIKEIGEQNKSKSAQLIGKNSSSRSSGFPRMIGYKDQLIIAWTDATDSMSIVKTFKIELENE